MNMKNVLIMSLLGLSILSGCIGFPVTEVMDVYETISTKNFVVANSSNENYYVTRTLTVRPDETDATSGDEVRGLVMRWDGERRIKLRGELLKNTKVHVKSFDKHVSYVPIVIPFIKVYFLSYDSHYQIRFVVDGEKDVEYIYSCDDSGIRDLPIAIRFER